MDESYVIKNKQGKYLGRNTEWTNNPLEATKGTLGEIWRTVNQLAIKDYDITLEENFNPARKRDHYRLYKALTDKYGIEKQCIIAIEEMAELQKELTKDLRGIGEIKNLIEEIADVEIMIEQLKLYNDIFIEVEAEKERKLDRTYKRLNHIE